MTVPTTRRGSSTAVSAREPVSGEPFRLGGLLRAGIALCLLAAVSLLGADLDGPVLVWSMAVLLSCVGLECAFVMGTEGGPRKWLGGLQLGPISALGFTLVFGVSTLVWLLPDMESSTHVRLRDLQGGAVVAAVGLYVFTLVYAVVRPRGVRVATALLGMVEGRRPASLSHVPPVLLCAASLVGASVSIVSGSLGYLTDPNGALTTTSSSANVLSVIGQLGVLSVFLAGWGAGRRPTVAARVVLTGVLSVQVALGLFSGLKEQALVPVLAAMLGYGLVRPFRWRRPLAALLFTVFLVVPFVQSYRAVVVSGNSRLSPLQAFDRVDYGAMLTGTAPGSPTAENPALTLAKRLTRVSDTAIIVTHTPVPVPYADATELLTAPAVALIPRSLWPTKPILAAGYEITRQYYGLNLFTSNAITPAGDLWRHGGWPVVILGMGGLGWMIALVDSRKRTASVEPHFYFLPLLLVVPLIKQEIDVVALLASLPGDILVSAVAARLASKWTSR